jgi:acyl dehydratase
VQIKAFAQQFDPQPFHLDEAAARSRPDRGLVVLRSNTLNQRGEVVQILTAKLMVARRTS